jgi:hypothetical protein
MGKSPQQWVDDLAAARYDLVREHKICCECRFYPVEAEGEICSTCVRELPWWDLWCDEYDPSRQYAC